MRKATLALVAVALCACNDVRAFRGTWSGPRVGEADVLKVGVAADATATLAIETIDTHGLTGHLTVDGLVAGAPVASLTGAEADALSDITFTGAPVRVYLSFVAIPGTGEAFAVIALYDDHRIEVRLMRGGAAPVYAIFALSEAPT